MKRCFVCSRIFNEGDVVVEDPDKEEYQWWSEDLSHDKFKDHQETPGICSGKCLHVFLEETGQE
jgi:hypothetical protein